MLDAGVGATGILPWFGVGQSEFMWFVRTRPRVAAAFRQVWRVTADEPMLSSSASNGGIDSRFVFFTRISVDSSPIWTIDSVLKTHETAARAFELSIVTRNSS